MAAFAFASMPAVPATEVTPVAAWFFAAVASLCIADAFLFLAVASAFFATDIFPERESSVAMPGIPAARARAIVFKPIMISVTTPARAERPGIKYPSVDLFHSINLSTTDFAISTTGSIAIANDCIAAVSFF